MSEKYVKISDAQDIVESITCGITSCYRCPYAEKGGCNVVSELYSLPTVELPHWHDLRKNPDDLPKVDKYGASKPYIIKTKDGKVQPYTYELWSDWSENIDDMLPAKWKSAESNGEYAEDFELEDVVKWIELPKDEDMEV